MAGKLKKAVVAQFLAAVKSALSHVSELKIVIADGGEVQSGVTEKDALQLYSRVRRLRECLRRWMSAYPEPEELGLDDDDTNLLCSCLLHEMALSEKLAEQQGLPSAEDRKAWIKKRNAVYHAWAVDLATGPVDPLPSRWRRASITYDVRQTLVAIREKTKKPEPLNDTPTGFYEGAPKKDSLAAFDSPRIEEGMPFGLQQSTGPRPNPSPAGVASGAVRIVDSNRIKDYRLRLTMAMDVRAYHRCVGAEDHRLALVLLGMILEGILLDYGLAQKDELGLQGAPSKWPLPDLVTHAIGALGERDSAILQILESSARALRPSSHLEQPFVVNKAMVQEVEAFVTKVSSAVGLGASGGRPRPATGESSGPQTTIDPIL